ncbi:MAG: tripartite tricarboxylate transporter substrate binding protein [Betaproteobacteria bacterium]|nr:MAG: tripartite tricarboxylate transporter substrate binding protein [Betaproteobacteria bacterium]
MRYFVRVSPLVAVVVAASPVAAQDSNYPSKPIRVVVPFTAGSATDLLARMYGTKLLDAWGQQVVVDNRAGAGSTIGTAIVAGATPDGHTLLLNSSAFAGSASIYPKLPYDPHKDFKPISLIAGNPLVLVVGPSLGVKSVKDLVAMAKSQPGKLTFASSGVGSGTHYGGELFAQTARINVVDVTYRGTPETITDTVSGRIHYAVPPILASLPLVREGRLIALGVTSPQRSALLPDVPTVAEAGVPGYKYEGWFGFLAPARTPAHIVEKLGREIIRIAQMSDIKEKIAAMGGRSWHSTPEEFEQLVRTEIETRGKVFKQAGVQPAS